MIFRTNHPTIRRKQQQMLRILCAVRYRHRRRFVIHVLVPVSALQQNMHFCAQVVIEPTYDNLQDSVCFAFTHCSLYIQLVLQKRARR